MKLVLDTNILISGTFWSGAPFRVLKVIEEGTAEALISKEILDEYDTIVQSEEILDKVDEFQLARAASVRKIILNFVLLQPKIKLSVVENDPDDDKFLELAVVGDAQYIVSRDKHLLKIKEYRGIKIVTPEEFLNWV